MRFDYELIIMFVWNIDASMLVGNYIINSHERINIFIELDHVFPDIIIFTAL